MSFFRWIKNNIKDPKKKSLTLLGIYFVFFAFVIIVLRTGNTSNYTQNVNNSNETISGYDYIIRNSNNTIEIQGTYKDNQNTFNYNGINYYKENNDLYIIENGEKKKIQELDFNIDIYSYQGIEKLIKSSKFIEKTIYNDNKEKIIYNISAQKYFELLDLENNCNELDCSIININITVESLDYINHVIIDLNEYNNNNIEIFYSNIN